MNTIQIPFGPSFPNIEKIGVITTLKDESQIPDMLRELDTLGINAGVIPYASCNVVAIHLYGDKEFDEQKSMGLGKALVKYTKKIELYLNGFE